MAGIYLHIPFCQSRCAYCDFYSSTFGEETRHEYAAALCAEIAARTGYLGEYGSIDTIYIGGGTPSALSLADIDRLLETVRHNYNVSNGAEITIEANPDDVSPAWVEGIRGMGINRVSLGVQSFDDAMLAFINRRHTAEQAVAAVDALAAKGLDNVSVDLMFGLPGQSLESFGLGLDRAMQLPIKHLSAYSLTYERGTRLYALREKGEVKEADEELSRAMFERLMYTAAEHGFEHYEISNFCKPGFASRHNSGYWNYTPYLGCGTAAHSFDGTNRQFNKPGIKAYIDSGGRPQVEKETLNDNERFDEFVMTGLRTSKGVDLAKLESLFGKEKADYLAKAARRYIASGDMERDDTHLHISRKGIFISDYIMSDMIYC